MEEWLKVFERLLEKVQNEYQISTYIHDNKQSEEAKKLGGVLKFYDEEWELLKKLVEVEKERLVWEKILFQKREKKKGRSTKEEKRPGEEHGIPDPLWEDENYPKNLGSSAKVDSPLVTPFRKAFEEIKKVILRKSVVMGDDLLRIRCAVDKIDGHLSGLMQKKEYFFSAKDEEESKNDKGCSLQEVPF